MRNISPDALESIAIRYGTEPICIIEVQWVEGGAWVPYADRAVNTIPGRILQVGELDSVITIDGQSDAQQINLTLDDTDGTLKNLYDTQDLHQRPVRVYQWFEGLQLTDKFILFVGQVNSPIEWNEGDRTLSFSVITKIEDTEIGFSAEQGQFPQIPDSLIGRPWPLCFGTVLDVPAIQMQSSIRGTTQEGVGIISGRNLINNVPVSDDSSDLSLGQQLALMSVQISVLSIAGARWLALGTFEGDMRGNELLSQANSIRASQASAGAANFQAAQQTTLQRNTRSQSYTTAANVGVNPIHILGGEDFPQGTPVTVEIGSGGFFTGVFNCQTFTITSRTHPDNEARAAEQVARAAGTVTQEVPGQFYDISAPTPTGTYRQSGIILGGLVTNQNQVDQVAQQFWADAGSAVRLVTDRDQYYIVSIVPGTVLAVKAYKRFDGVRKLVNVPNNLWTQISETYGEVTAQIVKLTTQLSSIDGQGWEDDVYVTFQSDVGPNTVDIIQYLVETYTDLEVDPTSFAAVRVYVDPFPSSFMYNQQTQVIALLKEIAFQARCSVFIKEGVVYLNYLPVRPTSVKTITVSDVEQKSLRMTLTGTEQLVTKMVVNWRASYADGGERQMILRHNTRRYGVQEQTYNWFIYNQPDIILKAATFWLIRYANCWKRATFRGHLNLLAIETLDAVTLNLTGILPSTLSLVEKATYDSAQNSIDFECWLPLKPGQQTEYPFAWPYSAPGTFPAPGDDAGSDFSVTGDLPTGMIGSNCLDGGGVIVGGPNIAFVGPADIGDRTPRDTGFVAQPLIIPTTDFNLVVTPRPNPNLGMIYAPKVPLPSLTQIDQPLVIDLANTLVIDSERPATKTTLGTMVRYDSESDTYAARRAYLAEDT